MIVFSFASIRPVLSKWQTSSICLVVLLFCIHESIAIRMTRFQLYPQHNAKKCHTNSYRFNGANSGEAQPLVVRRGNVISLSAFFDSTFNSRQHRLTLRMHYEGTGGSGSVVDIPVSSVSKFQQQIASRPEAWLADLYRVAASEAHIELYVPISLAVGKWSMAVLLQDHQRFVHTLNVRNEIWVLFNPWNNLDTVYMPNDADRYEYVLNEVGRLYTGSYHSRDSRDWYFEQFGSNMLKIVHFIMLRSGLSEKQRASPLHVSRAISALVNSNDENGVIMGRWDEPFKPHRSPWYWAGSAQILDQYYNSNGSPVRYGQCWVFGGVATTLARTLGIPARPITAYGAGHDSDNTLTIDRYFDKQGNEIQSMTGDSIWNFHVWTECWFRRNDLGSAQSQMNPSAGHWQVIDATPQEPSVSGRYELGPTQVGLIRSGETAFSYDMRFVYSEVNADVIFYQVDAHGKQTRTGVNTASVGKALVTRGPGGVTLDITSHYKYREGTKEERNSFRRASKGLMYSENRDDDDEDEEDEDIDGTGNFTTTPASTSRLAPVDLMLQKMLDAKLLFEMVSERKQVLGKPMIVRYRLVNARNFSREVYVNLAVHSIHYNGHTAFKVLNVAEPVQLKPLENLTIEYRLAANEYLEKRVEFGNFRAVGFAQLAENNETFVVEQTMELQQPNLEINFDSGIELFEEQETHVNVLFTNPLNTTLTSCVLTLKDELLFEMHEENLSDVAPLQRVRIELPVQPLTAGNSTLIALINCEQLYDLHGSISYRVNVR